MKSRAALIGAVAGLALLEAGTAHALSFRSSAAEAFLGDVPPGSAAVYSKARGSRLRLENAGGDPIQVEIRAVSPPKGSLKPGYEPWPYPERVRLEPSRARLAPGEGAEVEMTALVPKEARLAGGQYQFDATATAYDRSGASLTLKTRTLLSVGAPLAVLEKDGRFARRDGYSLMPGSSELDVGWEDARAAAALKIVNAGSEDVSVTLVPAREWDEDARVAEGYEPAPNPRWLRIEGGGKIRAGAIGSARIGAEIPKQARYAGRKWVFVVAVDAVGSAGRTRRYYTLHVRTPEWRDTQAR